MRSNGKEQKTKTGVRGKVPPQNVAIVDLPLRFWAAAVAGLLAAKPAGLLLGLIFGL